MKNKKTRIVIFLVTLIMLCSMSITAFASCPDCGVNMAYGGCGGSYYDVPSACPQHPTACVVYNNFYYSIGVCQTCGDPDYQWSQHLHSKQHDTCAAPDVYYCNGL